jgi:hypothetical protein
VEWNQKTGDSKHRLQMTLPPEEQFESFAARIRPFTIGKEPVCWSSVLDALEKLLSAETLAELVDIDGFRAHSQERVEGSKAAQAYYVITENGTITDMKLADLWLNSDALHTQQIQSAIGKDMSLTERYKAAAGVYSRIGVCVEDSLVDVLLGRGGPARHRQVGVHRPHIGRHRNRHGTCPGLLRPGGRRADADRSGRD